MLGCMVPPQNMSPPSDKSLKEACIKTVVDQYIMPYKSMTNHRM